MSKDLSRIIEMAWEDRTPFEAIAREYDLREKNVIALMRRNLNKKTFKNWRKRVSGRTSKHEKIRNPEIGRGFCKTQYKIRGNR